MYTMYFFKISTRLKKKSKYFSSVLGDVHRKRVATAPQDFPSGMKDSPTGKQTQENALTKGSSQLSCFSPCSSLF